MTTPTQSKKDNYRKPHAFAFWVAPMLTVMLAVGLTGCVTINPPPAPTLAAPASAPVTTPPTPSPAPVPLPAPTPAPVIPQRIQYNMPGVPISTTYFVVYSKSLQAGDKVDGFVQLTGQYYSADNTYEWQFQILGPGGESMHQWKGNWANDNYHQFSFTASYAGSYKLRVTHGSMYSKNLVIELSPPGWGYSG